MVQDKRGLFFNSLQLAIPMIPILPAEPDFRRRISLQIEQNQRVIGGSLRVHPAC
jgi:hypothetical protein